MKFHFFGLGKYKFNKALQCFKVENNESLYLLNMRPQCQLQAYLVQC